MKKITFLFMMLLSITAFSQVEIVENFDNTPDYALPAGWTASTEPFGGPAYNVLSYYQCGGTGKIVATGANLDYGSTPWTFENILTTPNYPAITNDTDLTVSFSINVFEEGFPWSFPITQSAPVSDWGSVTLEYSVDGGTNWITAVTINPSDLTYVNVNTCTTIPATNLGPLAAGNDFQARFVSNLNNIDPNNFSLNVILDNVSITQIATTIPNCDVTLLSPLDGSVGADLNDTMTWQAATGIPTGYTVSIGTTSGGTEILDAATTSATSYSLAGLGLTYSTEYFVNIVPYNEFGSATTGCTEESFTTRNAPIQGATCSNPFVIDASALANAPYAGVGQDTSNFENNVNLSPCSGFPGANIDGYDVFYEITPITDISVNITLAQASEWGSAIHVTEGCPDSASECVAIASEDWITPPPNNRTLQNVVLTAGTTYVITISSAGFDSTFSYSLLLIEQNPCINPTMTVAPIPNCASNEFTVDVDVTYLGDATSLTLTDNFGNSNNNITATGIMNFGPYASADIVEFTLTNNDEPSCSYTVSTFYYCPPSNDDCGNAIDLTSTINTDDTCTLVTPATNAGATESGSNPINCDFTGNNDVWFSFVASSETMILEYLNVTEAIGSGGTNQATELLDGSCGTFTSLGCFTNTNYVTLNSLTIGNTYYIRNSSSNAGEFAQNYDICLKEAPAAPANDECANATVLTLSTDENCDNLITGTTVGATPSADNTCNAGGTQFWGDVWYEFTAAEAGLYQFNFNDPTYSYNIYYFIYSGTCGALVDESTNCYDSNSSQVQSMAAGESRYIVVRSVDTAPGFEFTLCVFKLPPPAANNDCSTPTVLLASTDANGNNAISGDFADSYPSPEACDVGGKTIWYSFTAASTGLYHFNLIPGGSSFPYYSVYNTDDCSLTSNNYVDNSGCYGNGPLDTDLVAGNTYLISVYSFDNNNVETFDLLVYPDASLSVENNNFETFKYYPNPVVNTLTLEAKDTISNISIYNILGQQVQSVTPNNLKTTINMDELNDGVYFVTVTINNSKKTIKIIKK